MKRFWRLLIIGLTAEMIGFLFSFLASNQEIERLKTDNANLFIIASQAGKAADRAKESSAQAIEAAEKAKTERLLAEKENLGLRTKLIELEIKAGKRHLTDEQKTSVRRSLIGVTGGRILFNNMAMGDEETVEYEKELIEFLNQIGFDAKEAGGFISEIPEFLGMQFRVKAINLVPPFAGAILEAFKDAGINVSGFAGSDMADAKTIEIRIGKKPPY
jgi:hypothetical protein